MRPSQLSIMKFKANRRLSKYRYVLNKSKHGVKTGRNPIRKNNSKLISKYEKLRLARKRETSESLNLPKIKREQISCVNDLLGSLKSLEPTNQLELWKHMIDNHSFDLKQLRFLRAAIDDRIRLDIISGLPYEIALYIISFLTPKDLCHAAQTCRSWRTVCEDNRLWREKCEEENLIDDEQTLDILFRRRISNQHIRHAKFARDSLPDGLPKSEWKAVYLEHMNILKNWRTRKFDISERPLSPVNMQVDQATDLNIEEFNSSSADQTGNASSQYNLRRSSRHMPKFTDNSPTYSRQNGRNEMQEGVNNSETHHIKFEIGDTSGNEPSSNSDITRKKGLMKLRCHEDSVITCLQYNPRTDTIVSGSDDQTLKVWSSETGRCISTLVGHTGGVWSSQLSPDDIVISGSTDRTLRVWEAHTGKLIHTLYGHTSTVRCLALDGKCVVSGSRDRTIRLWNIETGNCINIFCGHSDAVRCVEYKNNMIVSGAYDHLVMVWDAISGLCLYSLSCHEHRIYSLQFDGTTIASGSLDATIGIWDAASGKLRHRLHGHTSMTSKMELKGDILVSANADTICKVWNIKTGECLQTLEGENKHKSALTSVYFNRRHIVTASDDGTVKLWDVGTGQFIRNLIILPTSMQGGVVWKIRASYTKLICAVGSRTDTEDTQLLVLDFNA